MSLMCNCIFSSLSVVVFFPNSYIYSSLFILLYLLSQCVSAVGHSQDSEPNRILLVTIHHMLYPITVEVLHQVFSPHGFVEKIVTFQKSAGQLIQVFFLHLI